MPSIADFREFNLPIENAAELIRRGGAALWESRDPLIMSYERGVLGEERHEDIIVLQQVAHAFKVLLNARDENQLSEYLKKKMGYDDVTAERTLQELQTFFKISGHSSLGEREVILLVENSVGWANAPQSFRNSAEIVKRLLSRGEVTDYLYGLASEDRDLSKDAPFVRDLKFQLGYASVTKPMMDIYGAWQAMRRYAGLGLYTAAATMNAANLDKAHAPFPEKAAPYMEPEIKRAQAVSRLYLATVSAVNDFGPKAYEPRVMTELKQLGLELAAITGSQIKKHFDKAVNSLLEGSAERMAAESQHASFIDEREAIALRRGTRETPDIDALEKKLTRYFAFHVTILKEQELITPEQYAAAFAYITSKVERHSPAVNQIPFLLGLHDAHKAAAELKGAESSFASRVYQHSFASARAA